MENKKPAILFDVGGVLLDWNPRYLYRKIFNGDEEKVEDFLTRIWSPEWNQRIDSGLPFLDAIDMVSREHPASAELIHMYYDRWEEMLGDPFEPNIFLLESLAKNGYELYCLTNFPTDKFEFTRARFAFFRFFRDIVVSADVKLAKPDPRIFALTLQRMGRLAPECIFIDDTEPNVVAARQLGMRAIHHVTPLQLRTDLAAMGVSVNGRGG
jgi:2-haloacid dehalogenase